MSGNVIQIRDHGPLFELRPPHTADSLRASAAHAQQRRPWLCRHGRHRMRVVGDVHVPEAQASDFNSLVAATLALVASADTAALVRCERCGVVKERLR